MSSYRYAYVVSTLGEDSCYSTTKQQSLKPDVVGTTCTEVLVGYSMVSNNTTLCMSLSATQPYDLVKSQLGHNSGITELEPKTIYIPPFFWIKASFQNP